MEKTFDEIIKEINAGLTGEDNGNKIELVQLAEKSLQMKFVNILNT